MNYQTKLFRWQGNGYCLIIITRGRLDRIAIVRILNEIVEITQPLDDCKILVDFQDTLCDCALADLSDLKFTPETLLQIGCGKLKLAILTSRHPEQQYHRVSLLKTPVSQLGIEVGVFYEEKWAIDWLAGETRQRFS